MTHLANQEGLFAVRDAWSARMLQFKKGHWADCWGPAPGKSGCLMPRHLQEECIFDMSGVEIVLKALFMRGPLWDGNVPSKLGRNYLVRRGYVERYEGFQQLTRTGLELAVGLWGNKKS